MIKISKPTFFKNTRYEDASLSKIEINEADAERLSAWIFKPSNILFLSSIPGVGKTYICSAVINHFYQKNLPVYYISECELLDKVSAFIQDGRNALGEWQNLCDNYFMIWDDLGSSRTNSRYKELSPWLADLFFVFLEKRIDYQLPTIITSNYTIDELRPMFNERVLSRLTSSENTLLHLRGPDRRKEQQEKPKENT